MTAPPAPYKGFFDGNVHHFVVRVYHEDTDASGRVYHGSYLRWFERARSDILELLGIDQRQALDEGTGFYVVSDIAIRYRAPSGLGDAVEIVTICNEAKAASARMAQVAVLDGETLCEADYRVGFVGQDGKPRRQPKAWRDAFAKVIADNDVSDRERE